MTAPESKALADQVKEQAQVFASAWAIAGGRFDFGDGMEKAEEEKACLMAMIDRLASLAASTPSMTAPESERVRLQYEWLAPKLSTIERKALDVIYGAASTPSVEPAGVGEALIVAALAWGESKPDSMKASANLLNAVQTYKAALAAAPKAQAQAGGQSYVHTVPDHCDRIIWRGSYYHLNAYEKPTLEAPQAPPSVGAVEQGEKVWLWKNGDHYLAYKHLYPCFEPGGDPMTLGEPVGYAVFRESHDRSVDKSPELQGSPVDKVTNLQGLTTDDAAHALLAILEQAGEGATVADVLNRLATPSTPKEGAAPVLCTCQVGRGHAASCAARAATQGDSKEALCMCKDRAADKCPGEWEPGCDLGSNPKYVRVAPVEPQAVPAAGGTK